MTASFRWAFRGASAELPRPGFLALGAILGPSSWAILGPSCEIGLVGAISGQIGCLVPSAQVPSALCSVSVARAPTRPMRNLGEHLPNALAAKLPPGLPRTFRGASARRLFAPSSLHAFPLPVNPLKKTFGTTLIYFSFLGSAGAIAAECPVSTRPHALCISL